MNATDLLNAYLTARQAAAEAEEAKAAADAALVAYMEAEGISKLDADGMGVTLIHGERVAYDFDLLAEVAGDVAELVSVRTVDRKKLKAAIALGALTEAEADKAATRTTYTQLRVR